MGMELVKIILNVFDGYGIGGGPNPWLLLLIIPALFSLMRSGAVAAKKLGRRSDSSSLIIAIPLIFLYIIGAFITAFLGLMVLSSGKDPVELVGHSIISKGNRIILEALGVTFLALLSFYTFGIVGRKRGIANDNSPEMDIEQGIPIIMGVLPALIYRLLAVEIKREDKNRSVFFVMLHSFFIDLIAAIYTLAVSVMLLVKPTAQFFQEHWVLAVFLFCIYHLIIKMVLAFVSVPWLLIFRVRENEDLGKGKTVIGRFYSALRKRAFRRAFLLTICFGLIFTILIPVFYRLTFYQRLSGEKPMKSYDEGYVYIPVEDGVNIEIEAKGEQYFLYERESDVVLFAVSDPEGAFETGRLSGQPVKYNDEYLKKLTGITEYNGKPITNWVVKDERRPEKSMEWISYFMIGAPCLLILMTWLGVFLPYITRDYRTMKKESPLLLVLLEKADQDISTHDVILREGGYTLSRNYLVYEGGIPYKAASLVDIKSISYKEEKSALHVQVVGMETIKTQTTTLIFQKPSLRIREALQDTLKTYHKQENEI